jgi:hypothetical protein
MASSEHTAYFILNNGCILYLYHVSERSNAFLSLFSAVLSAHIKQLLVDFQLLCVYQRTLLGLSDSDVHAHIYGILQNQLLRHLRLRPTLKSYFCLLLVSGDAYESLSGILPRDLSLLSLPTRYCAWIRLRPIRWYSDSECGMLRLEDCCCLRHNALLLESGVPFDIGF